MQFAASVSDGRGPQGGGGVRERERRRGGSPRAFCGLHGGAGTPMQLRSNAPTDACTRSSTMSRACTVLGHGTADLQAAPTAPARRAVAPQLASCTLGSLVHHPRHTACWDELQFCASVSRYTCCVQQARMGSKTGLPPVASVSSRPVN